MKALAQGKSEAPILTILVSLIQSTQGNYGDQYLDSECIKDISDTIESDKFNEDGGDGDRKACKPRTGAIVMCNSKFEHLDDEDDEEESKSEF